MLGQYDNFPTNIQGIAQFTYPMSAQTLQRIIAQVLHSLNKQTIDMKTLTKASPNNCVVNFEFGVADADTFNFLNEEELQKLEVTLKQQALPILDVFCAARYYVTEESGKRKSLKFDYSMLRFAFYTKAMELLVYHERGNQRIPLEDLVLFIQNQINKQLTEKQHKTLTLNRLIKTQLASSFQQSKNNL